MTVVRTRVAAAVLTAFLVVIAIQDLTRGDVSATEHWISHLSLGSRGWVNIVNLAVAGAAIVTLAPVVGAHVRSRWPARWVRIAGVGLFFAGVFVSDAPPGTRYDDTFSWHGQLHDVAGVLTFVGLFATCLTTRRLLSPRWGILCAVAVATAWVAASILAGFNYADGSIHLPSGVAERVAMLTGTCWLIVLALHLGSTTTEGMTSHELPGISRHHPHQDRRAVLRDAGVAQSRDRGRDDGRGQCTAAASSTSTTGAVNCEV